MSKTLYLMRHGQTLFNERKKIQGWSDAPLTALGIKQAQVLLANTFERLKSRLRKLIAQPLSELPIL